MENAKPPHRAVIGAALVVGVTGDILVRSSQEPGLNGLLFFVTLALAIGASGRMAGHRASREAWSWIIAGIALSSGLVLRASPVLRLLAFFTASAAFAFPALRAGAGWVRRSGVSEHLEAVVGAAGHAALGGFRVAADVLSAAGAPAGELEDADRGRVPAVVRGVLLAAPFLLVFGALFMSADRVFYGLVTGVAGTAVEEWASHVVVTGILAWLATGYLTGFRDGTRVRDLVGIRIPRRSIGIVEAGVALGLVDLLFAAFVAIQFRYLFGGSGLVEVTPGLTYAEYAREGFGQLALASALVLPALLGSDWLVRRTNRRDRVIFRTLASLQLILLVVVIASAFQRVRAYQDAYGLTGSRFYGVAFLGWLTLLSVWFGATVLRGRRDRFAFPALLSGLAVVVALFIVDPDVWIARRNLARSGIAVEGAGPPPAPGTDPASAARRPPGGGREAGGSQPALDAAYLASLSADAVPTLLRALPRLGPDARCLVARRLLERWGTDEDLDWRSWNRAVVRARRAVRGEAAVLRRMVGAEGDCPPGT